MFIPCLVDGADEDDESSGLPEEESEQRQEEEEPPVPRDTVESHLATDASARLSQIDRDADEAEKKVEQLKQMENLKAPNVSIYEEEADDDEEEISQHPESGKHIAQI